ncbi:UNVERIFIED_CONTAM: hypothetical protein Sangu_1058600 [Sesamum angustifolium]|uniref:C2H2-type domain-containing protein n=1 Tax=Sesamum angustifolium TaxID=2727405 RepID=A0AAW2NZT0_9LAMI
MSVMPIPKVVVPLTRRRFFDDVDQPWGISSWPKAKRSKTMDDCVLEEEDIVAECLLMLARSAGGFCVSSSFTDADSASVVESMEGNQSTSAIDIKKDQEPSQSADPATIIASSSAAGGRTTVDEFSVTTTSSPTNIRPSAPKNSFPCNICGKICPSHQALGGHKTSHRPKPQATTLSSSNSRHRNAGPSGRIHQCAICQKIFPTGQALGGHMRKHYEGTIGGGASSHATVSVIRNFDLNLPPPPEFSSEDAESA